MPSKRLMALMDPEERKESMRERRAEARHPSLENKESIHINPNNRGKFTRYAKSKGEGVQAAAHKVVKSKTASTKLKREAQFAINAKKFKH